MSEEFVTIDAFKTLLNDRLTKVSQEFISKQEYRGNFAKQDDTMKKLNELSMQCKKSLVSHTKHITNMRSDVEKKATKQELAQLEK